MSEWQETTLGDIITLQRGHDLARTEMKSGSIPVAGSNGVIGYHNEATTKAIGITIGRSGNIGNAYLYKEDFWAHNTTLYVKDFKGNDKFFVYYLLKSIDFAGFNVGSAVPTLNRNHIHPMVIQKPPLEEQKAIASVLSSLDDKIDLLHRQNTTLEHMAETFFRQWFVEEAQEDWDVIKLGDLASVVSGYNHKQDELLDSGDYLLSMGSAIKKYGFSLDATRNIKTKGIPEKYLCQPNDIFLTTRDITQDAELLGSPGIIPPCIKQKVVLGSNLYKLEMKNKKLPISVIYFLLRSEIYREYVKEVASGTSILMLKKSDLDSFSFKVPPISTLVRLDELLSNILSKLNANFEQEITVEKLRDNLLPKLMSGEVTVTI